MSQQQLRQQQLDIEEKMRKLKEMKQQEEEFDKHLAQTVPVSIFFLNAKIEFILNSFLDYACCRIFRSFFLKKIFNL